MKVVQPKPFTFQGGDRAVLLLHGFTGHSGDVRMLGRFLEKNGYTCHAPIYAGHGVPIEELLHTGPEDWWDDVLKGYEHLKSLGHSKIAVCGLSLGGVFSLKLATEAEVVGAIPMCAPTIADHQDRLKAGMMARAKEIKQLEGKNEEQVAEELSALEKEPFTVLERSKKLIDGIGEQLDLVYAPTMIAQGRLDKMINTDSATMIYKNISSEEKHLQWYEKSGHAITFGPEKDQLHEDIYAFLQGLNWES
ncbi:alpha/beta fold hydrolase [Bacillaceae bacterium SIJ1]|uniref:alpha/beta hydrolase n=1 Tax=Litoribacterium kuwaitense TaxID=1398745 RepID=UPI0013EA00AF|nr:alpha/beta fold hydrolase [Litoribacterium kuwaitense]NGP45313.1 alpha/beta fold hydrolase [Litoribacterium kuwaitense]